MAATLALAVFTVSGRAQKTAASEPSSSVREVTWQDGDILTIAAERGYTTTLQLPEKGVAVICGDCKEVDKDGRIASDSPGKWIVQLLPDTSAVTIAATERGARTNANIMGASGRLYYFKLREISQEPGMIADLVVRVKQEGAPGLTPVPTAIRYVSAATAAAYKEDAQKAERALEEEQAKQQAALAATREQARAQIEANIKHDYTWSQNAKAEKTFGLRAIYAVDGFTVIDANPQEAPALYEIKDGKDSLVQFTLVGGKYVCSKVINDGYLRVGKSKLTFHREVGKNG